MTVLAAAYRERARRALEEGRRRGVLPERAGLYWRTHDHGLLAFHEERLEEETRALLRGLLGGGRDRGRERAACEVLLLYGLAAGGVAPVEDPAAAATLPGGGLVLRRRGRLVCLCEDPALCLAALAAAEEAGRRALMDRLLGAGPNGGTSRPDGRAGGPHGESGASCGRCEGLLGGPCCTCAGEACVNFGSR